MSPPNLFRRIWRRATTLLGARRGSLSSPTRTFLADRRDILPSEELAALRIRDAEATVAGRLDPHQTKVPQYPRVTGRSLQRLGYWRNEVVRRAFDLIVESATQAIPELRDASGQAVTGVAADGRSSEAARDFETLMRCPAGADSDLTGMDLWVRWWLDVLGTGNGMLEMVPGLDVDFPVRLWRMDPTKTFIVPSETDRIEKYVYQQGGQFFDIPKERVIHFRLWDPLSDFWGIPRLFSALRSLATDLDLIDMMKVMFQNLGVPPVVLEYPLAAILEGVKAGTLPLKPNKDDLEEIGDVWHEKYGGKRRGRAGVAWGFEVKMIGLDFEKLAIGELVATTERRILMAHGINPLLVGQSGTEQQRGHNFTQAREFFYASVIQGFLTQVAGVLSARLAPRFGDFTFGWRTDHIDILRDARLRRGGEAAEIFKAGLLKRHACQRLIGEPVDGPDIFYPDVYSTTATTNTATLEGDDDDD